MEHAGQSTLGYYIKYQVCKSQRVLVQTGAVGNKYQNRWANCPKWGKFGTCAEQVGPGTAQAHQLQTTLPQWTPNGLPAKIACAHANA